MHNISKNLFNIISRDLRRINRSSMVQRRESSTVENEPPFPKEVETPHPIPLGVLGQATCHTHPHLIDKKHLTAGISQEEYQQRRDTLVTRLIAEEDNPYKTHIVVIPAAPKQYMSDRIPYVFRQNSDFYYLTGCNEPSAILVLLKPAQIDAYQSILFVHDKDAHSELWEGPRTGCEMAVPLFAVNESQPIENFSRYLNSIAQSSQPAILWYHNLKPSNPEIHASVRSVIDDDSLVTLADPLKTIHFMRVIKSPAEVQLMKEACEVGAQSVNLAMSVTRPGISEHALSAVLEYSSKLSGAEHAAFPPVVGGGPRGTHIHYVANNQLLREGDMVLVDSGCQKGMYNSDISRTWPVSGRYSKYQRILYEIVLSVQKRLIELIGEHRPPLDQLFEDMCRMLGTRLQSEGILRRDLDNHQLLAEAYRLCPHHVSHYLGLDVHDAPLVRRSRPVLDNMVVTVEPGIYIDPEDKDVPPEFRGIGIRIEDDVLITEAGPIVLTQSCVKEVADVESLIGLQNLMA